MDSRSRALRFGSGMTKEKIGSGMTRQILTKLGLGGKIFVKVKTS